MDLKVSRCGLILRVGHPIIKPETQVKPDRDWFGGGKRVSFAPMHYAARNYRRPGVPGLLAGWILTSLICACAVLAIVLRVDSESRVPARSRRK